ncbi:MAG: S8 family serine peptidase [Deltaproteobacteria bacterium]|nr:S8 family serine peptidase [Deltaproteobacteria bacterium]
MTIQTKRFFPTALFLILGVFLPVVLSCSGGGGGGGGDNGAVNTYSLSGVIQVPGNTAVDSDVNDPKAPYAANDSIEMAQNIPNPATLGGFANVKDAGPAGRSRQSGDPSDFFKVTLAEGQHVTLYIADSDAADLDLALYNTAGAMVKGSFGTSKTESIDIDVVGDYCLEVSAYAGASNYILVIGQVASPGLASDNLRLQGDFIPGQAIIRFHDRKVSEGDAKSDRDLGAAGCRVISGRAGGDMLITFDENPQADGLKAAAKGRHFASTLMEAKYRTLMMIKKLRHRGEFLYAEPNFRRRAVFTPNDPLYGLQWHYSLINLPRAWDVTSGSGNVIVAVVDTGVLLNHPDLYGQLTAGYDFVSDADMEVDNEPGIDDNPDDPGDQDPGGSSFHGTHVAGTIAALTNNRSGVAGAAWSARVMPVRSLGKGGGTIYDLVQGIRFAAGLSNDSGTTPERKADVVNLSLGGEDYSQAEFNAVQAARNAGLFIVAAAGNESSSVPFYPASYAGVLSVSAVDMNKELAPYSNYGTAVDVAAPGGDTFRDVNGDGYTDGVLSTCGNDASGRIAYVYRFYEGTSMATPHVSAVISLMKAIYADLTPGQFESLLAAGQLTQDLGSPGRDNNYGYGLIDAFMAVRAAQDLAGTGGQALAYLTVSPAALNFGGAVTSLDIMVENSGDDALDVQEITDDAPWLTIESMSVDDRGLGTYRLTVDRTGLPVGIYTAAVTVVSSANTVTLSVIMQVTTSTAMGNAGRHYVLLIDSSTGAAVKTLGVNINGAAGTYTYTITGVREGAYRIFAGTDSNNDGFINDACEALGAYLILDQPSVFTVESDMSDLNFSTEFRVNIQDLAPLSLSR